MSEDNDKLDDLFRSRFEDVELPVSDKLLANIKKELDVPKPKRKFGAWIWIASFLAVVGLAWVVIYNINNAAYNQVDSAAIKTKLENNSISGNEKVNNENIDNKNANTTEFVKGNSNAAVSQIPEEQNKQEESTERALEHTNKNEIAENKQQTTSEASQKKNNVEATGHKKAKSVAGTGNETSFKTESEKANTSSDKKAKALNKEKQKTSSDSETSSTKKKTQVDQENVTKQGVAADSKTNTSTEVEKNTEKLTETSKKATEMAKETPAETMGASGTDKEEQKNVTEAQTSSATGTATELNQDSIALKSDSVIVSNTPKTDTLAKPKDEPKKETKEPKKYAFFVELNGGPSQSFRMFQTDNNRANYRDGAENPYYAYGGGVDAGILFKNKYQVTAGIGIDNKGEDYYFKGQAESLTYNIDSFYVYYDTIFDSVVYTDSTLMYTADTVYTSFIPESKLKQRYQYLKIPVMFGYRFNINEKWFITPNVGVVVNYLISGSSTWFDPDRQELITYNAREKYRTIVFAGRAKIDIGFNVNERWSILLQPGYTRYLQSIYRKEEPFKHYPYSYDLNLAVRYTF